MGAVGLKHVDQEVTQIQHVRGRPRGLEILDQEPRGNPRRREFDAVMAGAERDDIGPIDDLEGVVAIPAVETGLRAGLGEKVVVAILAIEGVVAVGIVVADGQAVVSHPAVIERGSDAHAVFGPAEGVGALAPAQDVVAAEPVDQSVVAGPPDDHVVVEVAEDEVVQGAADDVLDAFETINDHPVIKRRHLKVRVLKTDIHPGMDPTVIHRVDAGAADQDVGAGAAGQNVVAGAALDAIAFLHADKDIRAVAADDQSHAGNLNSPVTLPYIYSRSGGASQYPMLSEAFSLALCRRLLTPPQTDRKSAAWLTL